MDHFKRENRGRMNNFSKIGTILLFAAIYIFLAITYDFQTYFGENFLETYDSNEIK